MGDKSIHMSDSSYDYIVNTLEKGKTILELGSGYGTTVRLSEHFKIISVENQPEWQNKFSKNSTYINVGNKYYDKGDVSWWDKESERFTAYEGFEKYDTGWYNPDELLPQLPNKNDYDMIIVDGPGGWLGRSGFLKHIDYFNTKVPIVIDDIQREQEMLLLKKLSSILNRDYIILDDNCTGVI